MTVTNITLTPHHIHAFDKLLTPIEHKNEVPFNMYVALAESVYESVCHSDRCDADFVNDSLYPELSVAKLVYNHFCDMYVDDVETPHEHLSLNKLIEHYDRDPDYAYVYLLTFNDILRKYHAETDITEHDSYKAR